MLPSTLAALVLATAAYDPPLVQEPRRVSADGSTAVATVAAARYEEPRGAALARALDAIRLEDVKSDIFFIASDELGGRDTPSPGQRIAARFLRNRLERLGFQPGARDSYFYPYKLTKTGMDESGVFAEWKTSDGVRALKVGEDYVVSPMSFDTRDSSGTVVYVGEFEDEDVADLELRGKWCLTSPGARISRRRLEAGAELGIAGLLIPPGPDEEGTVLERHARTLSWMRRTSLGGGRFDRSQRAPVLYLTEALSSALGADRPLERGATLDGTFRESFVYGPIEDIELENVAGLWPGSDPDLRNEVLIVSAHYDHVGTQGDDIYNGADDNGSGTTGLLAIAQALSEYGPMRRTVLLLWVSGEEKGLLGSDAWTKDPWLPAGMRAICDLNIDMIGRNATDEIGVTPTRAREEYNRLTQLVEQHMGEEGFTKLNSADAYWNRSDHANFSRNMGIPVAFLFSDVHEDYHKPTDTPDKIDYDKIRRVSRLVVRLLHDLQVDDLTFEATEGPGR